MKTFSSIDAWRTYRNTLRAGSVGFVPTMGALHRGHLSLLAESLKNNAFTIASVFVNPRQFDDGSDFEAYQTDYQSDLEQLKKAGVDAVLMPDTDQVYADGYRFRVSEVEFSRRFCGADRPGHFDGVLTVVMKLLNLVRPDNAYFGKKDFQQLQLVRDMVAAFFMPVNIVACPTIREADGLALSSRNQRLDDQQRQKASTLFTALKHSKTANEAREILADQGFEVDYVEDFADRRLAAVRLGHTRLIDNVPI